MKTIMLLSKEKSKTAKALVKHCEFTHNTMTPKPHAIINYGLQGKQRMLWYKEHGQEMEGIPIINDWVQISRCNMVKLAESGGIPVPETHNNIKSVPEDQQFDFVIKQNWANIPEEMRNVTKNTAPKKGEYLQRYMSNKTYEIRVAGFLWEDLGNWLVWKKKNVDLNSKYRVTAFPFNDIVLKICIKHTEEILKKLGLLFGSANFIFDNNFKRLEFLEINTCPKFLTSSKVHYQKYFEELKMILTETTKEGVAKWISKLL